MRTWHYKPVTFAWQIFHNFAQWTKITPLHTTCNSASIMWWQREPATEHQWINESINNVNNVLFLIDSNVYMHTAHKRCQKKTKSLLVQVLNFLVTSADYPGIHPFNKHYIYPLMPSLAHLLPLTRSARQAVHGELGFNRWKKIWVYPSVPVNS